MRKLKKIRLSEDHVLSSEEMAMLEGGDILINYCTNATIDQKCAVNTGEFTLTGYCSYTEKWDTNKNANVRYFYCNVMTN